MSSHLIIGYSLLAGLLLVEALIMICGHIMLLRKFGRLISKKEYEKRMFMTKLLEEPDPYDVYMNEPFRKIMKEGIKWKQKETEEAQKQHT